MPMPRARFTDNFRRNPFAALALALLAALTIFSPAARAQPEDGGGGGGGGGENPPQVDPNSPMERLRVIRESELDRISGQLESTLERLFNLSGEVRQVIRREADRSVKGMNEIARRANRRLDAFQRLTVRELRNQRATPAKITELQTAIKDARTAIKAAQTSAVRDIRARAQQIINGQIGTPNPPVSP
ncbi:MAG: hypothetical protein ACKVZJ_15420 [Phycisphaerales bacterium]